jgi:asparagine synthase (glutamine-hydrolysing)
MCGITGVIGANKYHSNLELMTQRLSHRGPDDKGVWCTKNISFGHTRLKIIDTTDHAHQPMIDEESGNVITYNGEIYNYVELRSQLKDSYQFKSTGDTEIILAAYRKYGLECFEKLRGMFAFALYDAKKNIVIVARDRFGIKPIYYRNGTDYFLFASEIKSLINSTDLSHSANPKTICRFLAARQTDVNEETFFSEVKQVLPGNYLIVNNNGALLERKSYWEIPIPGNRQLLKGDVDELVNLLENTIGIHLRADVPVGAFLSGGIDSATIVSFMERLLKTNKFHTFSSLLENQNEENKLIKVMQQAVPSDNHNITLTGEGFIDDISNLVYHQDEPFADASMYAHYALCREASKQGLKVLLSGNGGDEIFGGYYAYLYSNVGYLIKYLKLIALIKTLRNYKRFDQINIGYLILKGLQQSLPTKLKRIYKHSAYHKYFNHLNKEFHSGNDVDYYYFEHRDPRIENYINMIHNWTLPQFLHYEDRNGMAFGIELRVPFVDHVLLEKVNEYDSSLLVDGRTKSLLREMISTIVPDVVKNQKGKFAFAAPLDILVKQNQNLMIESYTTLLETQNIFDKKHSLNILRNYIQQPSEINLLLFWRTYISILWFNKFF